MNALWIKIAFPHIGDKPLLKLYFINDVMEKIENLCETEMKVLGISHEIARYDWVNNLSNWWVDLGSTQQQSLTLSCFHFGSKFRMISRMNILAFMSK